MAVFGYCERDRDPSLMFANSAPPPRQELWSEGEAVRLAKRALREGYRGLAVLLAVAWDSQLSPVSRRATRLQDAYLDGLPAKPVGMAPIFRNRSGKPYSKDTLGDDFRAVRCLIFGAGDNRQLRLKHDVLVHILAG